MPRTSGLLTRRRALLAGSAACALAVGAAPAWHLLSDRAAAIRRMIEAHMGATPIEDGAIDSFARDFLAHRPVSVQGVAIGNVCDVAGLGDLIHCANNADYLRRVEGRVIDLFLRSTDLFSPTRRAGDALSYVAFWDPYSSACRNPFADLTPP